MKNIYVTHCSREKEERLALTGDCVTPDQLYTSSALQEFIHYCQDRSLDWAIFSDHYGVVFPEMKIRWYSKPPDTVTEEEFKKLVDDFVKQLSAFDTIYFYHRKGETHPLFYRIVELAKEEGLSLMEFSLSDSETKRLGGH